MEQVIYISHSMENITIESIWLPAVYVSYIRFFLKINVVTAYHPVLAFGYLLSIILYCSFLPLIDDGH